MVRVIPKKAKVKSEFMRGFTGLDLILALIFIAVAVVLFLSNFSFHVWLGIAWLIVAISMY